MALFRTLVIGDVVGLPGRMMVQKHLPHLKREYNIDFTIVNGENSGPRGRGITPRIAKAFKHVGADVITTGNHIWAHREIYSFLNQEEWLLRPANFPAGAPGRGAVTIVSAQGISIGIINLQGRIFMREQVDCPFRTADSLLTFLQSKTKLIFVDFHAEATSEKSGLAYYLDGKISALFGTHTHVPSADERVLPHGTAFITDIGMVGALNSMLGMQKSTVINQLVTQLPTRFEVEVTPPFVLYGAVITVDSHTGKACDIQRVKIIDKELVVDATEPID